MISRLVPTLAVLLALGSVPFALGCCFGGGVPTGPAPTVAPVVPAPPMMPPELKMNMPSPSLLLISESITNTPGIIGAQAGW